jgi:uncharacterized protein (DUF1800 family)
MTFAYPKPASDADAARFLLQAQFSASDSEITSVRNLGYAVWLVSQFAAPASTTGWDWLNAKGYATIDAATAYYDNTYPGDYMIWYQLMKSTDGVRKRVALALSEILVVSLEGINISWRGHAIARYWDHLVANAFGNYRDLLEDITLCPAMGIYLSTRGNEKENAKTGRQPDENYAREVMQLFTIGLYELNQDGTYVLDAGGKRIESYDQDDITNLARVFTGWDYDFSQTTYTMVGDRKVPSTSFTSLPMTLTASKHSTLAATFLGVTIPANTDGHTALAIALDTLFNHPNVGPFIGRQLIQRLVTSNPSPGYVSRVAAAFNNNGSGVRGDLKAVIKAILLDDEARGPADLNQGYAGRLREPMLRLVQWGRTFGLAPTQPNYYWKIGNLSDPGRSLGQSPLRSPSVFNFFRPGYVPPSPELAAAGAVAPEFQIVNESSVSGYLNFMQDVVRFGFWIGAPDLPQGGSDSLNGFAIVAAYTTELFVVANAAALVSRLNLLLCAGQLSQATVDQIVAALNATPVTATSSDTTKLNRIAAAILLVMASPEYLILK